MTKPNKQLLDEVINKKLLKVLDEPESEEAKVALKEAITAIDRQNEMVKMELSHEESVEKRKLEENFKEKEFKNNTILRIVEVAVIPVTLATINIVSRNRFAKRLCNFEKDYTFTTTAGRSLGSIFKWK